ncbi:MAG: hypothetical protein KBT67_05360 [bacterium]|nr:hypothetical protein [Candidatus Limimorpha caballi]
MKIKMKSKKIRGVMSVTALLLALTLPPAAHGQSDGPFSNANGKSDGFFSNAGGVRNGYNGGVNGGGATLLGFEDGDAPLGGGATLQGFEDGDAPLGGGLLVLALSGVCYAGAKRRKSRK